MFRRGSSLLGFFSRAVFVGLSQERSIRLCEDMFLIAQNKGRVDVQGVEVIPIFCLSSKMTLSGYFAFLDFDSIDGRLLRRPTEYGVVQLNYQTPIVHNWDDCST